MINDKIDTWVFDKNIIPQYGHPVFILIESDVVEFSGSDPEEQYNPLVEKAVLRTSFTNGKYSDHWELVNVSELDPNQEKILQQVYTVVAWRYV